MSGNAYAGIDNYKFTTSANIVGHGMVLIDAGVVDFSNAVEVQKNGEIFIILYKEIFQVQKKEVF